MRLRVTMGSEYQDLIRDLEQLPSQRARARRLLVLAMAGLAALHPQDPSPERTRGEETPEEAAKQGSDDHPPMRFRRTGRRLVF